MGNRPTVHVDRRVAIVMEQVCVCACACKYNAHAPLTHHALTTPSLRPHNDFTTPLLQPLLQTLLQPLLQPSLLLQFIRMLNHVGLPAEDMDYIYCDGPVMNKLMVDGHSRMCLFTGSQVYSLGLY